MNNKAISAILEHLCNEGRNSAHATFSIMQLLRETAPDSLPQGLKAFRSSGADQMLRSIDDVRDLLSDAPLAPAAAAQQFDLALCAGETIEILKLAPGRYAQFVVFDAPPEPLLVTQDRHVVGDILSRVLDICFKLAEPGPLQVTVAAGHREHSVQLSLAAGDSDLAVRLANWSNADIEHTELQDPADVPFGIAVMVAGKRLRALGGAAELVRNSAGKSALVLDFPSIALSEDTDHCPSRQETRSLSILVAEDCDDSFALTELVLQNETVRRAPNGTEALSMIQKQRFDVVLMDVHMPGMDGYAVIRKVREWETQTGNARTPIVVLSSDDLETQRRHAARSGCSGFLRKPVRRSDLIGLLDRLKEAQAMIA